MHFFASLYWICGYYCLLRLRLVMKLAALEAAEFVAIEFSSY
jgi:hypothetical protein